MGIEAFIRNKIFGKTLRERGVLVVYDPDRRYRDLCRAMEGGAVIVVDASESSIESREAAMAALPQVVRQDDGHRDLLIYVPAPPPLTDEAKQVDPFAAYGAIGAVFPDRDSHSYLSLCLRAKPDHDEAIRRLFDEDPAPPFALIDGLGGGLDWPTLRHLLGAESGRDILLALLAPNDRQSQALKDSDAWVKEARALLKALLGLSLKTKGKTWSSIADELWRFLLFSEFRFDLPEALPQALADVPHAPDQARTLVEDLCDTLRGTLRLRPVYVARAEAIEEELTLPTCCAGVPDLGMRDTFQFEERTFLAQAVAALGRDDLGTVRAVVRRHADSVWGDKGENREQWDLLKAALALVEACDDADRQFGPHPRDMDALIGFYVGTLRRVDQLQRAFEQALGDHVGLSPALSDMAEQTRRRYGALIGKVQPAFMRALEQHGWPAPGRLANTDVFDRFVAPLLAETGRRVAFIIVDALRYELGVALADQLGDGQAVEVHAACAPLPTITPVGMAALLPGASAGLSLKRSDTGPVPELDGTPLPGVAQRMQVLRGRFGDRFAEHVLKDFVKKPPRIPETVGLLVLRDTEIDAHLETAPETTLGVLKTMLRQIRRAVGQVREAGFHDVVIATDHGFFLNGQAEAGDVCPRPPGDWVTVHHRSLLGEGDGDGATVAMPAAHVGIRGDFGRFAGPRSMAPYRRGLLYFHGGASLQEAIVPVLTLRLTQETAPASAKASVTLRYRKGATKKINSRLPVIEISVENADLFSQAEPVEMQVEAQDRKAEVVGEPKAGGAVNAASGTVSVMPGQTAQVTLKMVLEFEGRFVVKALNPTTQALYATLELETDYVV